MFRPDLILPLLPSALTVAILAAVESLLSAVVADSMIGDRHNSNAELVAQGIANLASLLVGGIPVTGAIARTATNFRSGAKTPISGMVHSLTLLAILLVLAPLAKFVPLATLAAVLLVVAYNMSEWREVGGIFRTEIADILVWLVTFVLTVVADLTVAVEIGMSLAALLTSTECRRPRSFRGSRKGNRTSCRTKTFRPLSVSCASTGHSFLALRTNSPKKRPICRDLRPL
jgi:SulP family sulfate permease